MEKTLLINAAPLVAALKLLQEVHAGARNRRELKDAAFVADLDFRLIGKRIKSLEEYLNEFGPNLSEEESNLVFETALRLFLLRERKLSRALHKLDQLMLRFERDRVSRWVG